MHQAYALSMYFVWGACMPWRSDTDHGELCLQQAVILGVLSFFMAWVVQAFFASVLLDIVNAGMPTSFFAMHFRAQGQWLCHVPLLLSKVCRVPPEQHRMPEQYLGSD